VTELVALTDPQTTDDQDAVWF